MKREGPGLRYRRSVLVIFSAATMMFLLASLHTEMVFGASSTPLTLEKAFEIALSQNPSVERAKEGLLAAKAGRDQALSAFFPRLDLVETLSRTNSPPMVFTYKLSQEQFTQGDFAIDKLNDPSPRTNFQSRLVLTQPLFNQGREWLGYKFAKLGEGLAALGKKKAMQAVLFSVEKSFYRVLLAREAVEVLEDALKTARAHEDLADKRYRTGVALKSDVLSAQVQRTDVERQLIRANGDLMIAMAALNQSMGTDQDRQWEPVMYQDQVTGVVPDLDYWLSQARVNRPEILSAKRELEAAGIKTKEARWRFLPSINLQGVYESDADNIETADGDSWALMATASLNLFNGLGDTAALRKAEALERQARSRVKEVEHQVDLQVRKAYFDLLTAQKQLEVSQKAVESARESLRILKKRYEQGLCLMVELLAADTALKEASLKEAQARFDVRVAVAALKFRAGIIGKQADVRRK